MNRILAISILIVIHANLYSQNISDFQTMNCNFQRNCFVKTNCLTNLGKQEWLYKLDVDTTKGYAVSNIIASKNIIIGTAICEGCMTGIIFGINKKTGQKVWQKEDSLVFHSLIVVNNSLIFTSKTNIISLSVENGKTNWTLPIKEYKISYGSPVLNKRNIFYATENNGILGVDFKTGIIKKKILTGNYNLTNISLIGNKLFGVASDTRNNRMYNNLISINLSKTKIEWTKKIDNFTFDDLDEIVVTKNLILTSCTDTTTNTNYLIAVNPLNSDVIWKRDLKNGYGKCVIDKKTIYLLRNFKSPKQTFGFDKTELITLNLKTGNTEKIIYENPNIQSPFGQFIVTKNLIFLSGDYKCMAIEPNEGKIRWQLDGGIGYYDPPIITGNALYLPEYGYIEKLKVKE
jgi:outer membrane protein assembly factor BamB